MPTPHNKLLENRAKEAQEATQREKAIQWHAVKKLAPEIANFMIEVNDMFGKPKFVQVEHDGKVILKSGEQDCCEKFWDGKLRSCVSRKFW